MKLLYFFLILMICYGCSHKVMDDHPTPITSLQIIDRNGFSETISTKDRLALYKNVDFLTPQSYEKVLRVYGKDADGKNPSKITTYHANGLIRQYLELIDNRAHGMYREWHPNGILKLEVFVIEGMGDITDLAQESWLFHGKSTVWTENGEKTAEIYYDKGVLAQTASYYYPNGALSKTVPYEKGAVHGSVIVFNEQEIVVEEINYAQGQEHGHAFGKWDEASFSYKEAYEFGKLITASYFDKTGTLIHEIKGGKGVRSSFHEGRLLSTIEYENGIPEGIVKTYSPSGELHVKYPIHNGMKRGEEIHYYLGKSGQPKLSLSWHDDILQGVAKTWYENGAIESQREMYGNKKKGIAFAWYEQGDLMLMEEYDDNQLLKGSYFKKGCKQPVTTVDNGDGVVTLFDSAGHFLKKIDYEKGKPKAAP